MSEQTLRAVATKQILDSKAESMCSIWSHFLQVWPGNPMYGWHREAIDDLWEEIELQSDPLVVRYVLDITGRVSFEHWRRT